MQFRVNSGGLELHQWQAQCLNHEGKDDALEYNVMLADHECLLVLHYWERHGDDL